MNHVLDHIKQELSTLRPAERFDLWRDLGTEFDPALLQGDSAASVEAAWDEQIASRLADVEEGRIDLMTGEDANAMTASLLKELGVKRRFA